MVEINKHWLKMFIPWEQCHAFFWISVWITDRIAWFVCCCCCKTVTITCWFCCCSSVLRSSSCCRNSRSVLAFSCINSTRGWVRALLLWRFGFSSHSPPLSVDLCFFVSLYRSKAFCLTSSALFLSFWTFLTEHHQLKVGLSSLLCRRVLQVKHLFQKFRPRIFHLQLLRMMRLSFVLLLEKNSPASYCPLIFEMKTEYLHFI